MEKDRDESRLVYSATSENDFREMAGDIARAWQARAPARLIVGLDGPLGAGKTTWVRGMLQGLGYGGRVPSPTYTLLEHYDLKGLTVVHLDLYRLPESAQARDDAVDEFEALGVRDWLARDSTWLLVEWPGRSLPLAERCDVWIDFEFLGAQERRVTLTARSAAGEAVVSRLRGASPSDSSFGT